MPGRAFTATETWIWIRWPGAIVLSVSHLTSWLSSPPVGVQVGGAVLALSLLPALALLATSPVGRSAFSTTLPELGAEPTLVTLIRYWGLGLAPGTRFEGSGVIATDQAGLAAWAVGTKAARASTARASALLIVLISVPPLARGSSLALVVVLLVLFGVLLLVLGLLIAGA